MIDETRENDVYRRLVEQQLQSDADAFCPFRKEKQMEHLFARLAEDFRAPGQKVLDMCGGYGRLTFFLNQLDPRQDYYCLDANRSLIERAREGFSAHPNVHCEVADLYALSPKYDKAFDITVHYKTLSYLAYYTQAIDQLVKATRRKIYITSPFFDGDIDFISRIYCPASAGDGTAYSYSNTYGIPKFVKYCRSLGVKDVQFEDMRLDVDIPPPVSTDILQTHTIRTVDQGRLEVTGVLILNWKLAILTL